MKIYFITIILLILSIVTHCQIDSTSTLKPTGNFKVGTTLYEFTDYSRTLSFEPNIGMPRSILIQLWYPTNENVKKVAPYSALSKDYNHVNSNSFLRVSIAEDIVEAPLLIIVPGRGVERYGYTTLAEEFASNGYAVMSIDMPEIGYCIYQDGYVIRPNKAYSPGKLMSGPYEKVDKFFEKAVEIGVSDIEFALLQLYKLAENDFENNVLRQIDFSNQGVIGHSLGGRIGGAYAAQNKNVKAYMSMEGIPPRKIRLNGLNIPQAQLVSAGTYPYAKNNYQSIIDNYKEDMYLLVLTDFGHNSITDFPLITPSYFNYIIDPVDGLEISRDLFLTFFNHYLKKDKQKLKDYQNPKITLSFYQKP